jgi:hypothetical protein
MGHPSSSSVFTGPAAQRPGGAISHGDSQQCPICPPRLRLASNVAAGEYRRCGYERISVEHDVIVENRIQRLNDGRLAGLRRTGHLRDRRDDARRPDAVATRECRRLARRRFLRQPGRATERCPAHALNSLSGVVRTRLGLTPGQSVLIAGYPRRSRIRLLHSARSRSRGFPRATAAGPSDSRARPLQLPRTPQAHGTCRSERRRSALSDPPVTISSLLSRPNFGRCRGARERHRSACPAGGRRV